MLRVGGVDKNSLYPQNLGWDEKFLNNLPGERGNEWETVPGSPSQASYIHVFQENHNTSC